MRVREGETEERGREREKNSFEERGGGEEKGREKNKVK